MLYFLQAKNKILRQWNTLFVPFYRNHIEITKVCCKVATSTCWICIIWFCIWSYRKIFPFCYCLKSFNTWTQKKRKIYISERRWWEVYYTWVYGSIRQEVICYMFDRFYLPKLVLHITCNVQQSWDPHLFCE